MAEQMASAAAPKMARAVNRLMVDVESRAGPSVENFVVELSKESMAALSLMDFEFAELRNHTKHAIVTVVGSAAVKEGCIAMNETTRKNIRVKLSGLVSVLKQKDGGAGAAPHFKLRSRRATKVEFAAIEESVTGLHTGTLTESFLVPYFSSQPRTARKGDLFNVRGGGGREVWFKITDVEAEQGEGKLVWGVVDVPPPGAAPGAHPGVAAAAPHHATTVLICQEKPIPREEGESELSQVGYADIGGLSSQLESIREMVELPLRHPKLFSVIGASPRAAPRHPSAAIPSSWRPPFCRGASAVLCSY